MKKVFYQAGMVIALLLLLRAEALAAAVDMADMDMQFVDALGMTGYYVGKAIFSVKSLRQGSERVKDDE